MRVLVDESAGAAVVAYLRSRGHDVLAVAETMPQATDATILARVVLYTERQVLRATEERTASACWASWLRMAVRMKSVRLE